MPDQPAPPSILENGDSLALADLDRESLIDYLFDAVRRSLVHYGFWFTQVEQRLGFDAAVRADEAVFRRARPINMRRLGKLLGFEVDEDGVPAKLKTMPRTEMVALIQALAANWLANDGVWFQEVENSRDMATAKLCNDACWARLSPYEAAQIKRLAGLPDRAGLAGLKTALGFRIYAQLNRQTVIDRPDGSLEFQINTCRVQAARKKKNLPDYPCSSAGVAEFTTFAQAMDPRIRVECIGCPPGPHPEEWFCAWRFYLDGDQA